MFVCLSGSSGDGGGALLMPVRVCMDGSVKEGYIRQTCYLWHAFLRVASETQDCLCNFCTLLDNTAASLAAMNIDLHREM